MLVVAAIAALACGGCSNRPSQGVLVPIKQQVEGTKRVPILVATTRKKTEQDPGEMFGGERSETLNYAAVTVSIPPQREVGQVQWPATPPGDPNREFVTISADYIDNKTFAKSIVDQVRKSGNPRVLIFVHGFNNRFDDAVYRFAQIVNDSKAEAVPVLFTWPSRGNVQLRSYTYDRESANYSRDALEELIDQLSSYPSIKEIHVLAHSMGTWVTLEALRGRSMRRVARGQDKVKQAFLVAPDIDVDVFRGTIKRMGANRPKMLLFVSQDDGALSLSKEIWGGVPRIGEVNPADEPYRTELERERIVVFDLTTLKGNGGNAHSRAFDDIGQVMAMVRDHNAQTNPEAARRLAVSAQQRSTAALQAE